MPASLRLLSATLLALLAACGADPAVPAPAKVTTGEAQAVREAGEMVGTRPDPVTSASASASPLPPPSASPSAPAVAR